MSGPSGACAGEVVALPGTQPLTVEGDLAMILVEGVDRFLLNELELSVERRAQHWNRDFSSAEAYNKSIEPNRKRLARILGVRDPRVEFDAPELVATVGGSALVGRGAGYEIFAVRWPVLADPDPNRGTVVVHGEGLLLVPTDREKVADIVAIPDADQTPEQIVGLADGVPPQSQFARRLAESGCRVLVPVLISRERKQRTRPGGSGGATLTNREYVYRSAFELGRHIIGYELQKVLAAVDWFAKDAPDSAARIAVVGYGEGGLLAVYAAALDPRIDSCCASGSFGTTDSVWQQPLDRNVFGLWREFGEAELAAMVAPRRLILESARYPEMALPGEGGAPARLSRPDVDAAGEEFDSARAIISNFATPNLRASTIVLSEGSADGALVSAENLSWLLDTWSEKRTQNIQPPGSSPVSLRTGFDPAVRQQRQIDELDQFNQLLLRESPFVRREFMAKLDTSFIGAYEKSVEQYRETFRKDVIGDFGYDLLPPNARTRKAYETDKWVGYEVVLDVWPIDRRRVVRRGSPDPAGAATAGLPRHSEFAEGPGDLRSDRVARSGDRPQPAGDRPQPAAEKLPFDTVIAYGVLLVPKDLNLEGGDRRPVVVCQHGLEGRPQDVIEGDHRAYHDFAARLAERGFITFAPQNLYIGRDKFRTLQRKANPLGKTLFSIITPQHQQIVNWLKSLPYVDGERIAFYGLSYGGKTAMRVPALVTDYCLSICSADFNEWVLKNASTRHPFSYVWTGEYEIFEFDLGSTFNYAEMAALICPRPFMVERGHFDGVGWDEYVAYEYAKVRHLYQAKLGIGERTEIEWFVGPHTINGQGTFEFLHRHLKWPKPARAPRME